jgi:hypothetical protein
MKSVSNLIFYLHKFFGIFSRFLVICFELFSFRMNFNSEIADEWAPPVRHRAPRRARAVARLKAAVGIEHHASRQPLPRARPDSPALVPADSAPPRARRRRPDGLTDRAVILTASPTAPLSPCR